MKIKELLSGSIGTIKKIDKIYHIADIHIRNTPYHQEEYIYVFNELYKFIQETKTTNSLIVICGEKVAAHIDNITPLAPY